MTYQLIVMSFDGDYRTEQSQFENTDDAWDHAGDMGSKWYFYPFHFVVDQAGNVASAPELMSHLEGLTVEDLASHFREKSEQPEAAGVGVEEFSFMV
jgi:hypothetical protein